MFALFAESMKHLTLNYFDEMEATSTVAARMERIKLLDGGLRLTAKNKTWIPGT